jgi:phosphoribosyl 1,2-cyclic phosphodiesterase
LINIELRKKIRKKNMAFKICVLGSGSSGNCTYIESETTKILIDAGLSFKQICLRLDSIGVDINDIEAVCFTHEHHDHYQGLKTMLKRSNIKPYANTGTASGVDARLPGVEVPWNIFTTGSDFSIGDINIHPFQVCHDAYEPVGYILKSNEIKIGIVTDMGIITELVKDYLKNCDTLVLEANHDAELLVNSARPWSLKQRISGSQGHLSNTQACELLKAISSEKLQHIFLAHLSGDCNDPEIAHKTIEKTLIDLNHQHVCIHVTQQRETTKLVHVKALEE